MLRILTLLTAVFGLALAGIGTASAANAGFAGYTAQKFVAAQTEGKTIVVDVHADWCPTCRAQAPILRDIAQDARAAGVVFLKVDFDKDKAFLRDHRIPRQSTILVFKGKQEVGRSIAETNRQRLSSFVFDRI